MEDFRLWQKIQTGDTKVLQKLHDRYFFQMCLYAKKSVLDNQLIEDIVSDCFIKLWTNRKKIEIKTSLKSYLFRILRNNLIDHFREIDDRTLFIDHFSEIADEATFDEQKYYAKLYQTIEKLPEQRKIILKLAVFEALSYQEIAHRLQISKNTVKTQIARAYRFLRENLHPHDFNFFCLIRKK